MNTSPLIETIESMSASQREGALVVLDHLTRPLTQSEIAVYLRRGGVSLARANRIAAAVAGLHIVALIGGGSAS